MLKTALIVLSLFSPMVFAELVVVVNKNSDIEQLDSATVKNIFLTRTNRFPNGNKAKPIELKNNDFREEFYHRLTGKSLKQLSAYWTALIFSGKGKPPAKLNNLNKLLETVNSVEGTITYMDDTLVTDDVKVVYSFN